MTLPDLAPDEFADFVAQVHGHRPFPWQTQLAARAAAGDWPDAVAAPTGMGKTLTVDVAVFTLALQAHLPRAERTAATRTVFTVDRRLVVDATHDHARTLAAALADADEDTVVGRAAARLRALAGPGRDPLQVVRMRGGVDWDAVWTLAPHAPTVVTATVDQAGSRLLFRGYGTSPSLRPVDAGLVGIDTLLVVDEAHLSSAFATTARAVAAYQATAEVDLPALRLLELSATPHPDAEVLTITDADRADPAAAARLHAVKPTTFVELTAGKAGWPPLGESADVFTATLTAAARWLADRDDVHVVGVVVNTVACARTVHQQLADRGIDTILLTGRTREVDRNLTTRKLLAEAGPGRARTREAPLVVVATQTIEVGVNLDFDALVTEACPADAFGQRIGRADRFGRRDSTPVVVVHAAARHTPVTRGKDRTRGDAVYGSATDAAWAWLTGLEGATTVAITGPDEVTDLDLAGGGLDVAPGDYTTWLADAPLDTRSSRAPAPVLLPAHLDGWVQTRPAPLADPPVPPFLKGIDDDRPTVSVAWRSDLGDDPDRWPDTVDGMPVRAEECIDVPLPAVRAWLRQAAPVPVGDVDTADQPDHDGRGAGRPALLVRPGGTAQLVDADTLADGMQLVVPTGYGGADEFGWNPHATGPVVDVADLARPTRPRLRLAAATLHPLVGDLPGTVDLVDLTDAGDLLQAITGTAAGADGYAALLADVAAALQAGPVRTTTTGAGTVVATGRHRVGSDGTDPASSTGTGPVSLADHSAAVADRAAAYARAAGLDDALVDACRLAGLWHDTGKADPRFQVILHGGDELAATAADQPRAKSTQVPTTRAERRRVSAQAGWRPQLRHEAASARLAEVAVAGTGGVDTDLVVHLVGSSHGHGRPMFPAVDDPGAGPLTCQIEGQRVTVDREADWQVDWDGPARFARLQARYGRWGLAWLEALLRTADICCSMEGR